MPEIEHVVLFCVDQMQARCLGVHGHPDVRTPHLDRLAREGISFTRAYCANPVCMPSRASLLTGLTPRGHGCISNGTCVPDTVPTLPAALAAAGWRTHAVGKLHHQPYHPLPGKESWEDKDRWDAGVIKALPSPYYGFQGSDFLGGHVHYAFGDYRRWLDARDPTAHARLKGTEFRSGWGECWTIDLAPELHYNHWLAERSLAALEQASAAGRRQFLWVGFPDPHHPFAACRSFRERYHAAALTLPAEWRNDAEPCAGLARHRQANPWARALDEPLLREVLAQTYAMIEHVDHEIGNILAGIDRLGLTGRTAIAFIADHGEYLGSHHQLGKGVWPWEEVLNVPMLWRVPGRPAVGTSAAVASLLDVVPTVLELAQLPASVLDQRRFHQAEIPVLPGRSLLPRLDGSAWPDPRLVPYELDNDSVQGPMVRLRGVVGGRWKLGVYGDTGEGLLFDLERDPQERSNRWRDPGVQGIKAELLAGLAVEMARSDRLDRERIATV